ncbi:hypothetical protein KL935_004902 [Ogataea polymorpha]|nr:hypothetical protein KL937_004891 [Ogataea polymorpha]KAG7897721.1 hypothetical protein KL935_004902 [Ogataea polymorpha]KAG7931842.1 hypothetical protein KL904_004883 [Ogataea polymorpha]
MSIQLLSADLAALVAETKRKNTDIRHAADRSLETLKSGQGKDERAFLKSLSQNPDFINPFLLACQSKNAKLTGIALQCFSRLIPTHSLPATKVDLVIDALLESTHSAIDIQLKILQLLPSFFQAYSMFINDESLSKLLLVCSSLQSTNRMGAVVNTAQATFLQLVNLVFEKVHDEDQKGCQEALYPVPISTQETRKVGSCAYDAQRIVSDLCTLIEHHKPAFLKTNYITEDFGFELLESIVKNNRQTFLTHEELAHLLRLRVAPILLRFLSSSKDFTVMVRVSRLISLLIQEQFEVLKIESEVTLSLLNHILTKESATPVWKRILSLEIYRAIFKDFELVSKIFTEYDNNQEEERKKVFSDFFKACLEIVSEHKQMLNTGDLIQAPFSSATHSGTVQEANSSKSKKPTPSSAPATIRQAEEKKVGLSIAKSAIKFSYIDSLDKADPPHVPETYSCYLICQIIISFCEGLCKATLDLASEGETVSFLNETTFSDKSKQLQYACLSVMLLSNSKDLLELHKIFLYSTIDSDLFSKVVRSLQKLCHASGILSLKETRNEILNFFAISTLKLTGKEGRQNKFLSFGESIVGTISSTIGNAVSNMASTSSETEPLQLYSRNINSRQIMCLRVLLSLATSLGAVLDDNWDIIFITLQWVSYYLDGPSDINIKEVSPLPTLLNDQDLVHVESSLKKLKESLNSQSKDVFYSIVRSLMRLSSMVLKSSLTNEDRKGTKPVNDGKLEPCILNKSFFINKLTDICEINPIKFLVESDQNWQCISQFSISTAKDRSLEDSLRILVARNFNNIVKNVAVAGFNSNSEAIRNETENKILNALNDFFDNFAKLPISEEILVTNCEIEVQLLTLNTLKDIVDQYGMLITHRWDVVTQMLNSPFEIISNMDDGMLKEKAMRDIITSVLRSTFETLKVILDTVLQSIAGNQIKVIIDCLFNFVTQKFDLNISFNSISYFWLISDYLKEKIESEDVSSSKFETVIDSQEPLQRFIDFDSLAQAPDIDKYKGLWLYLILQLSKTVSDPRTQVRNGSIQTFFNVIDSYGPLSPSWKLIYDITLSPVIMSIEPAEELSVEWVESYTLIVNGLSKLFSQYFDYSSESSIVYWRGLLNFFSKLINLDSNRTEINLQVFKAFSQIVTSFQVQPPQELVEILYEFWAGFQISYNLSDDSLYQTSLSAFIASFSDLFEVLKPVLTLAKFEHILTLLNSCIRYPILTGTQKDDNKCTELQKQVIDTLAGLWFDDLKYESLLIQQLNLIVILPFSTRDLIQKKLGARVSKIPTFIAASHEALQLLKQHLERISDLTPFLNDRCIIKTYKALLEPSKSKDSEFQCNGDHLWMESMNILVNLSARVSLLLAHSHEVKDEVKPQLSQLLIQTFKTSFSYSTSEDEESESFDLEKYQQMKSCLVPLYSESPLSAKLEAEEFIVTVWTSSFLYALDDIENSILESSKSPSEVAQKLCNYDLNLVYGSTAELSKLPRLRLAKTCLQDLIEFSIPRENNSLFEKCLPYFISRCAFALRKLLSDERLVYKQPVPRIQQTEINIVLNGLMTITNVLDTSSNPKPIYDKLMVLFPLLVQAIAVKTDTNQLMQKLTLKLGRDH